MPGRPEATREFDWTATAGKWGAVVVLAALGGGGLTWSVLRSTGSVAPDPARATPAPVLPLVAEEGTFLVGDDGRVIAGGPSREAIPASTESSAQTEIEFGPPTPGSAIGPGVEPVTGPPGAAPPENDAPAPSAGDPPEASSPDAPAIAQTVNINTATEAQLQLLPAIGPARARAIIEDRAANGPFRSIDDLDRVRGIGPAIIEGLRRFARVS